MRYTNRIPQTKKDPAVLVEGFPLARLSVALFVAVVLLAFSRLAFGSAAGTIILDIETDEYGLITSHRGRAVLLHDDTRWWDVVQWTGDYAQINAYVDGQLARSGICGFIFTRAPRYIDDVRDHTEKSFSWWPGNLTPGPHVITFRMLDVLRGEHRNLGDYRREVGNVITEESAHVYVDESGNQYLDHDKEANLGFKYEQCQIMEGDPINLGTGNSFQQETDISINGVYQHLMFTRYYNSRSSALGSLGSGWTHTYEIWLVQTDDLHAEIRREDGGMSRFFKNPDEIYMEISARPTRLEEVIVDEAIAGWRWHRRDGSIYEFNSAGRLERIVRNGNETLLTYSAENRLTAVQDVSTERQLQFQYNAQGLLESISGPVTSAVPSGMRVTFSYDTDQNLSNVTYADGSGSGYFYNDPNDPHNLTEKRDRAGHVIASWGYDDRDRAIYNETRDGRGGSIDYSTHNAAEYVDAYGNPRTYRVATRKGYQLFSHIEGGGPCPSCGTQVVRKEYDGDLHVTEIEYAGGRIDQYADYDVNGNAGTVTRGAGSADEKVILSTYHPDMRAKLRESRPSVLGEGDKITIWDYDDDGNDIPNEDPTQLLYRLIEQGYTVDASGETVPYEYITTYTYNAKGQVTSIDGPQPGSGDTTAFSYDPSTGDLLSTTRPHLGTTSFEYDAAGQMIRATDPNGNSSTYAYDARERIQSIFHETDGGNTAYEYSESGDFESITDPDGVTYRLVYDSFTGLLTRILDPTGNYIAYAYDEQGNRTEESIHQESGERVYWKRYDYQGGSAPGKLWREINPDGLFTEYTYDSTGDAAAVMEPSSVLPGSTTYYDYDLFNRLRQVTQPGDVVTAFAYDLHDNLVSVTDAEQNQTQYFYDDMGRVIAVESPDTGVTYHAYDPSGNLISKRDANGTLLTYEYDSLNRLTAIRFPEPADDITFRYDEGPNGIGRMTTMVDPSGTAAYEYNSRGQMIRETKVMEEDTYTIEYAYSPGGRLTRITYPSGLMVNYELDATGQVSRVTGEFHGAEFVLADGITLMPFGPVAGMNLGNGLASSRTYDQLYRVSAIQTGVVMDRSYSHYPDGNISRIQDLTDSTRTQEFTYDELNRLVGATGVYGSITYAYDNVGNRLTREEDGVPEIYSYTPGTNKLLRIEGEAATEIGHDPVGNMTAMTEEPGDTPAAGYDVGFFTYVYDGRNHRTKKIGVDATTIFWYNSSGQMLGEQTVGSDQETDYIYLDGNLLAMIVCPTGGVSPTVYYYHTDHLGTPQQMTDSSGSIAWAADYKPFGEVNITANTQPNNIRFPGQYQDLETGMHYNYHRYYYASMGRYVTADPIGLLGSISLYSFVGGDPANHYDSLGLVRWKVVGEGSLYAFFGIAGMMGGASAMSVPTGATQILGGIAITSGGSAFAFGISKIVAGFLDEDIPVSGIKDAIIVASTPPGLTRDCLVAANEILELLPGLVSGRFYVPTSSVAQVAEYVKVGLSIGKSVRQIEDELVRAGMIRPIPHPDYTIDFSLPEYPYENPILP